MSSPSSRTTEGLAVIIFHHFESGDTTLCRQLDNGGLEVLTAFSTYAIGLIMVALKYSGADYTFKELTDELLEVTDLKRWMKEAEDITSDYM